MAGVSPRGRKALLLRLIRQVERVERPVDLQSKTIIQHFDIVCTGGNALQGLVSPFHYPQVQIAQCHSSAFTLDGGNTGMGEE